MVTITHAVLSDPGRTHDHNEDRWFVDPAQGLYLVSDGMANDWTPQVVIDTLPGLLRQRVAGVEDLADRRTVEQVVATLAELSQYVHDRREREMPWLFGVGATVVLALVQPTTTGAQAIIAHLGDSRAYLWREQYLAALTQDHDLAYLLLRSGAITEVQAALHYGQGILAGYVGMKGPAPPEARTLLLQPGDWLLLCSDGLTNLISDSAIVTVLSETPDPQRACERLVAAANRAGGTDNITALLVAVTG